MLFIKKTIHENINIKNNNGKNKRDKNIKYYYKEKVNKKFFNLNEKENNINTGNEINNLKAINLKYS